MQITVRRATEQRRGTHWRPVENTLNQRETIESIRREVPGDQPNKLVRRGLNIQLDSIDLLLAGLSRAYTEARIEDPYKQGHFVEGFVYVRALAAFVHKDEVNRIENIGAQIGPGVIISKSVRVEDGSQIGAYAELERGARVMAGASIGAHTVLRKGTQVREGAKIGAHTYLGQFMQVGEGANIGSMSVVERRVRIGSGADLGKQDHLGLATYVGPGAWLDDSVHVRRHGYIGANVGIGEMTTAGDYLHIGDSSIVGAESQFGNFVRVARNLMLISPTYAEDGAFISESNYQVNRPEIP